jgi:uncharacterized protein
MESRQVLWKRLDQKGMDACRIRASAQGWAIEGTAVFGDEENPVVNLSYRLLCENDRSTREAEVRGWIGRRDRGLRLSRRPDGIWMANDRAVDSTGGLLDVDLGFTPASNTNAIRRLDLGIGEQAETTAVWLDTTDWTVKSLTQTYERLSPTVYAYASPQHGYEAELQVDAFAALGDVVPGHRLQRRIQFPLGRRQLFPRRSFSTVLSSIASASIRFSRPFSISSIFSSRASVTSIPPYFALNLSKIAVLSPCSRQTSTVGTPLLLELVMQAMI